MDGGRINNTYIQTYDVNIHIIDINDKENKKENRIKKSQEIAERLVKEEADRLAKEEKDRLAKEEKDRLAKEADSLDTISGLLILEQEKIDKNMDVYGNNAPYGYKTTYNQHTHKLFNSSKFNNIVTDVEKKYKITENIVYIEKQKIDDNMKVIIIGDIHSSLSSFIFILNNMKANKIIDNDYLLSSEYMMVFLGDIVDRGPYSLELLYIIFKLKTINNNRVIICNGNHEDTDIYSKHGLGVEISTELTTEEEKN